jgi:hypothetical protein
MLSHQHREVCIYDDTAQAAVDGLNARSGL